MLNLYKPYIVHFSGHGNEQSEIILTNDDGESKPVSKQALISLFKTLKDNIRVVILNACYSNAQAEALTEIIDFVIGMSSAIGDKAAISFAASFYRAIGFGRSIQEAFEQGITSLLLEGIPEEDTPKLICKRGTSPEKTILLNELDLHFQQKNSDSSLDIPLRKLDVKHLIEMLFMLSAQHNPITMIYTDIDGLLGINKVHGWDIGNTVISTVEELFNKHLKDYAIFRVQGDQFVILLPAEVDAAMEVAQKCQIEIVQYAWSSIAPDIYVSCTFCIAQYKPCEDVILWLARAISGLKNAKTKGINQLVQAPLVLPKYYDAKKICFYGGS